MADAPLVCVDANILVDVFSQHPERSAVADDSRWVLQAAQRAEHRLVIPAHVIAELFGTSTMRPESNADRPRATEAVRRVTAWLRNSRFIVVEIDQRLAMQAGDLAQALNMKGADALVLAAAQRAGCRTVYTRDSKMIARTGRPELAGLTIKRPNRLEVPEQQAMELPGAGVEPV